MRTCNSIYSVNTTVMSVLYISIIIGLIIHIYYNNSVMIEGLDNSPTNLSDTNKHNVNILKDRFSKLETIAQNMSQSITTLMNPVFEQCCAINKEYSCKQCKKKAFKKLSSCNGDDYCNRCDLPNNKGTNDNLCFTQGICKPCKGGTDNPSYSCC